MISDIYVTLGQDQIKERGYRSHILDFGRCDGDKAIYCWRLGNRPKRDILDVFIVIGNKVRFKARFLDYAEGRELLFDDGRSLTAKCWMRLIDFKKLPMPYEHKKGFQGFRYKEIK